MRDFDYRDVIIVDDNEQPVEVIVVVGDGNTVFDENFEEDARVYFYFHDEAEFELAKGEVVQESIGFTILEELN